MTPFIRTIWPHHARHRREMPWRTDTRPYYVIVSEIMLQQTQVDRVMRKFDSFITCFPDWQTLASASTRDVLQEWSGLGYNRRALYLKRIAEIVVRDPQYIFLDDMRAEDTSHHESIQKYDLLRALPGIGPNTAGSILAFAFNIPHPFIETNIRSVFIHFFFPEIEKREGKRACKKISDDQLMPFIEQVLENPQIKNNPREWYYALMDYGSLLKKSLPNPSHRSVHHVKQKPFKGSNRELRSRILKLMMVKTLKIEGIFTYFKKEKIDQVKIQKNINDLIKEGFLTQMNSGALVIVS